MQQTPANTSSLAGDIEPDHRAFSLSQDSLQHSGFGPGQTTATIDSGTPYAVEFVMPNYNNLNATAGPGLQPGTDNVIAQGQTIAMPSPVKADYLDLLVTSTCGTTDPTASDAAIQVTENFANPDPNSTPPQAVVPDIPDAYTNATPAYADNHIGDAHITKVATVATRAGGTASSDTASLYHVAIRLSDTSKALQSITLPYMHTDLSGGCTTPVLHVFAIATHSVPKPQ